MAENKDQLVTASLTKTMLDELEIACKKQSRGRPDTIRYCIRAYLNSLKKQHGPDYLSSMSVGSTSQPDGSGINANADLAVGLSDMDADAQAALTAEGATNDEEGLDNI